MGLGAHAVVAFNFDPEDNDHIFSCSSILVDVKRRKRVLPESRTVGPHRVSNHGASPLSLSVIAYPQSTTESQTPLEDATNQGHQALSRYRKYGEKGDLKLSIEEFESALQICPPDHPSRAVAQSNLATAKVIQFRADDTTLSLDVSFVRPPCWSS